MEWAPERVKRALRSLTVLRLGYHFIYYSLLDIRTGRMRGIFFVGLANLLPDFYAFGFIRPIFWRLAGARMTDYSSSVIRANVFVEHPRNLTVGRNFQVNRDTYLGASGKIFIGNGVTISLGCKILTIGHEGVNHEIDVIRDTTLKDHCIIYAGAVILPGSIVEEYVVVAAGSVLKGATAPGGVYAGVPAVLKGFRKDLDPVLFSR